MDKILIITNNNEATCKPVIRKLELWGQSYIRINTEFLSNKKITIMHERNSQKIYLKYRNKYLDLSNIKSVWYRHPEKIIIAKNIKDKDIEFAEYQWQSFLWSLYNSINGFWMNNPIASKLLEHNKLHQMKLAELVGFKTPKTIITNDAEQLLIFTKEMDGEVALKVLRPTLVTVENKGDAFIYTNKVSIDYIKQHYKDIKLAPVLAQEYIDKKFELRVTVVNNEIFACCIDSQANKHTNIDWRKKDTLLLTHSEYNLSEDIKNKLRHFMKIFNLVYGAFDFIITPEGKLIFLEVNPSGQWLWIERLIKLPISEAIARYLISPV